MLFKKPEKGQTRIFAAGKGKQMCPSVERASLLFTLSELDFIISLIRVVSTNLYTGMPAKLIYLKIELYPI